MLSRRHIRLKVMQSLYSFFTLKGDIYASQKMMLKHIDEVKTLYLIIISLLNELIKYADIFFDQAKNKHFPTADDLNPNRRLTNNVLFKYLLDDKELISKAEKVSDIWLKNDHDIISKLFKNLYKSDLYKNYILNHDNSIEVDQKFISNAINENLLNNELVHHILEEKSIYWVDDLPFVATIIIGNFKLNSDMNIKNVFKDNSDRTFAIQLFRGTIDKNLEYDKIIEKFSSNWELTRIAIMDKIFLKMALTEILTMEELPIKVSMNEYIEISKYYSTAKSKLFVNGMLDNIVKSFKNQGMLQKTGKGLL